MLHFPLKLIFVYFLSYFSGFPLIIVIVNGTVKPENLGNESV